MNDDGYIDIPAGVGHSMKINQKALEDYKVNVEIYINKEKIF